MLGTVTNLISRPDVVAAIDPNHHYQGSDKNGYNFTIPSTALTAGSHTIGVNAIGNDGSNELITRTISMVKPNPQMSFDGPSASFNYYNHSIDFYGWALNASGIARVDFWLMDGGSNNRWLGSVCDITDRPDVVAAIDPNHRYIGSDKSGYRFSVPANTIEAGNHTVAVAAIGVDGSVQWMSRTISLTKPAPQMSLDGPSSSVTYTNQDINIFGLALNASGVARVDFYILDGGSNNRWLGSVSNLGDRPDVVAAIDPNHYFIGSNKSGFWYSFPSSSIVPGSHTIGVAAIGNDGSVQWGTRAINVK